MLLDSNIVIGAAKPSGESLAVYVAEVDACISIITRIEALGYHLLTDGEEKEIHLFLADLPELPLDDAVASRAIDLRKQRKMGLADAILAATALERGIPFVTRNVDDFKHIAGLKLINPFEVS
jgi:predicted nucleic acid-binding protein